MSTALRPHYVDSLNGIVHDFEGNVIISASDDAPTDGTAGYAVGALHFDTNAADGSQWLRNDGTVDSCDFNVLNGGIDLATLTATAAELNLLSGLTATAAEINRLDDSLAANALTAGAGVNTTESYAAGISRAGTLITTELVVDLSTLIGSATDLHIIGENGAASSNWGQITTAKSGTIIGGFVQCLEVPAGGADDIDFYSASVGTGTQGVAMTDAALGTEVALVTAGEAWTASMVKGMTGLPAANDYLYIASGEAAGGTYTAGKFRIVLFGLGS